MELFGEIFLMVNSEINKDGDRYLGEGKKESEIIFFNFL